ncbi:MAG: ABC transporter ATP-binding protein [Actinomycetia bacterium]|nr:ABC transporter ATP-binding protein [Actinomycetes bacterium]
MTAPLVFENLTVGYAARRRRRRDVLTQVSGTVHSGELVALVGPNGAGKSTLLRSLAGLQPSFGGAVRLCGAERDSLSRREVARRMAVVLTDRFDAERLTVHELVALGRQPYTGVTGSTSADDERVITDALTVCGALGFRDREVVTLSDGQRQRVLVARALAQQPSVLLLDEPTAFLDPPGRVALIGLLRELCTSRGLAVVVCTHDLEGVLRDADQVWVTTGDGGLSCAVPEQMILDGTLTRQFATPGVCFDVATLTFRSERAGCPRAVVHGDGVRAATAALTMYRAGYDTETAPAGTRETDGVWVSVEADSWTLHTPDGDCPPARRLSALREQALAQRRTSPAKD